MKQILIVDDQPDVREILTDFLTYKGFSVIQAGDGKIALEKYALHQPDAAVVDVEMPVLNGLQFSRQVLAENKDFPIIIITAYLQKYSKDIFFSLGVRSVLQKPIDLNELNVKLQEIFE